MAIRTRKGSQHSDTLKEKEKEKEKEGRSCSSLTELRLVNRMLALPSTLQRGMRTLAFLLHAFCVRGCWLLVVVSAIGERGQEREGQTDSEPWGIVMRFVAERTSLQRDANSAVNRIGPCMLADPWRKERRDFDPLSRSKQRNDQEMMNGR